MIKILISTVCIAALGAGIWFGSTPPQTTKLDISGFAFPTPSPLNTVSLINQDKQSVTVESFKGGWTFIYVGYTFCPDACPMTMTVLNQLHTMLETRNISANVNMMLVSVDPDRDTPEILKSYVKYFNLSFSAATGTPDNIKIFADQLRSLYKVPTDKSDPNYIVDHSSSIVLIDPDASVHAIFTPPQVASDLADDFVKISNKYYR